MIKEYYHLIYYVTIYAAQFTIYSKIGGECIQGICA